MFNGSKNNYYFHHKYLDKYFKMDNLIAKLYQSPKTILRTADLALIWKQTDSLKLKSKISYYVKKEKLIRLTRGVFTKNKDYAPKELAASIYRPSYVSFETVLRESGMIFQHYEKIFVATKWSFSKKIDNKTIVFRKLKDSLLYNSTGIKNENAYSIATPERAFLDMCYLYPDYYFDNLESIDWKKVKALVKIYNNQQLVKRINQYQKKYAK